MTAINGSIFPSSVLKNDVQCTTQTILISNNWHNVKMASILLKYRFILEECKQGWWFFLDMSGLAS